MNPLDRLSPEELASLSDGEFQSTVQSHARAKVHKAFSTIEDVMNESDDDQARLIAAGKILKIAKVEDEERSIAPSAVSEEVLKIALAGLMQAALLARDTGPSSILRDVSPARTDPRPLTLIDDSPLNAAAPKAYDSSSPDGPSSIPDYEIPGADIIEENALESTDEED
jgi:hypothetical protein